MKQYKAHKQTNSMQADTDTGTATNELQTQRNKPTGAQVASVEDNELIKELRSYLHADITDFVGVDIDKIKSLPKDKRKALQRMKYRKRTYTDTDTGQEVHEQVVEVGLVNKLDAAKELARHIGFYERDNKQKLKIDINRLDVGTVQMLFKAISEQDKNPNG